MMQSSNTETKTSRLKVGLAEMLKGAVIMDVTNAHQVEIAKLTQDFAKISK